MVHWAAVIDREIKPGCSYAVFNAVVGGFRQALYVQQTRALEKKSEDKTGGRQVNAEEIKSNVSGVLFIALFRMGKLAHRSSPFPILSANLGVMAELQSLVTGSRYNRDLEKAVIELVQ